MAKPLTKDVAALDYAAYMASPDVVRVHSDGRWPVEGFTLQQDLKLVAKHQADHEARRAFTFVLLATLEGEALGCLYLNPLHEYLRRVRAKPQTMDTFPPDSAMVTFWLRQDQQGTGLAEVVAEAVNDWLVNDWPIKMHLFRILPGEWTSRAALERLPLRRIDLLLPGEERPYLWYQPR
ncbi:GNAT family N-acetyltransferase [Salinispora pacifica]|uniref:GNAT family N-acetyltransferase n=1 Tax=Salinispora pacifica TaxID=351187 RepID=UPI0003A883E4|nr:GNAT family protein [Salinispora pacifica]